jgi:bacteriocin biosynthesis cyclodehydratase domain-containing protein
MVQPAIVVDGRGGLPEEICRQLRLAAPLPVHGGPFAADAAEALLGLSPRERPAAVVLVAHHTVTIDATAPWQRAGVTHLPVTCDGHVSVVGPLVIPGVGSCWRCHALTTQDLDAVSTQSSGQAALDTVALPAGGLGVLTAAVTASVVLAALAGAPGLGGVSTELEVDGPSVTHRHWGRHPLCSDCVPRGTTAWRQGGQETMAG